MSPRPPRTPESPSSDVSLTGDQPPLRSISSLSDASCLSDDTTASASGCEPFYRDGVDVIWSEPTEAAGARIRRVAEIIRTSASDACEVHESKSTMASRNVSVAHWLVVAVAAFVLAQGLHSRAPRGSLSPPPTDCVYVPGGGFSGFWFTLGRLRSIPVGERLDRDYYCYSAGCLAVVATALLDRDMEQMYDMAYDVQQRWKTGTIGRYNVVQAFLDDVLVGLDSKNSTLMSIIDAQALSRIHIITTAQSGYFGARTEIRSAASVTELHELLLQTTWIPYATGDGLWRNGHMDGAFSAPFHPTCQDNVGLAMHPWLLANVVNVNLPRESVEIFWNLGLEYGLH